MDYGTWSINYDSLNCLQAKQGLQDGTCWNFFYCRSILWQSTCMFAFGHTSCVFFFCSSYHPFFACGDPFGFLGNRMKQSCWTDQDDVMARCHHLRGSLCGNEIYGRGSHTCPLWLLELGDLCLWWWTGSLGGLCNRTHSWSLTREFGVEIWVGKQEEHQKKNHQWRIIWVFVCFLSSSFEFRSTAADRDGILSCLERITREKMYS